MAVELLLGGGVPGEVALGEVAPGVADPGWAGTDPGAPGTAFDAPLPCWPLAPFGLG
ncbi:MAG TPA: hypothetical protein VGG92_07895 [Caulobacteraceae bacterium]